jgi:hypothetical protein
LVVLVAVSAAVVATATVVMAACAVALATVITGGLLASLGGGGSRGSACGGGIKIAGAHRNALAALTVVSVPLFVGELLFVFFHRFLRYDCVRLT